MKYAKTSILITVVFVVIGAIYFISQSDSKKDSTQKTVPVTPHASLKEKSKMYELAKEITTPDGFINTGGQPITINEFIGKKVILVDFWTYSCINCQRTTPYLNSWYQKYKDRGFVIIGIHAPEFEFEKKYDNVKTAVEKISIQFPIVLDNDYSIWIAYKNQYWPRKYLIDIDGYVVYDHIGEGAYEETEQKIQEALAERMDILGEKQTIKQEIIKETPFKNGFISPETYFGSLRNQLFKNGKSGVLGIQNNLVIPANTYKDSLYLSGNWNIENEFSQNLSDKAIISYKYTAKDVFFVAGANDEITVEVLLDGKPIESGLGEDVIKTPERKTILKIKETRIYKIIQDKESGVHTLELIIKNPGLKAFTFTFG